jgi:hypothetical protein
MGDTVSMHTMHVDAHAWLDQPTASIPVLFGIMRSVIVLGFRVQCGSRCCHNKVSLCLDMCPDV